MIATKHNSPNFTPKEYFAWEETQLEKHEYIDGEVYAMSGGSKNYSCPSAARAAMNVGGILCLEKH